MAVFFPGSWPRRPELPPPWWEEDLSVAIVVVVDTEDWSAPVVWQPVGVPPNTAVDDSGSLLANFYTDQEDDWSKQVESVAWVPVVFPYDEVGASLANFYVEQEEDNTGRAVEVIVWPQLVFPYDETGSSLANYYSDDEADATQRAVEAIAWSGVAYPYDEIGSSLTYFYTDQEEDATGRAVMAGPWLPAPFLYDETSAGLVDLPVADEDPPLPAVWLPYAAPYAPAADDVFAAAPLALGDGGGPSTAQWAIAWTAVTWAVVGGEEFVVAPVTGSTRTARYTTRTLVVMDTARRGPTQG